MSTTQHTPGPWYVADDHPQRACLHISDADGRHIASLYVAPDDSKALDSDGVWRNDHVRVANAYAIAALPELLAAAKLAVEDAVADDMDDWFRALKAAIAKAGKEARHE